MEYNILIVDDHLVVRTGVAIVLKRQFQNMNISNAENFFELIAILKENIFDLIILDINIFGSKNTGMIKELRVIQPNIKILIFSAYEEEQYACRYILSGANGYLNKLCSEQQMILVVSAILENGKYIQPEIVDKILEATLNKTPINPLDVLSKREFEIAKLLIVGDGNLEIANQLNIQMSTVSTYKSRIFEKLKVYNIVELIDIFKVHFD
jgi:DNA-binding NarL/FixJ family response regulator